MLDRLNQSLEAFLRAETPLPAASIDISFDTPDKDWSARLVRPTVNVFLHEMRRSTNRAVTGTFTRVAGSEHRREALAPFVRLRYVISVWTTETSDAHQLLGDMLSLVATAGHVPADYLEHPLQAVGNRVELSLTGEDARSISDIWGGLGVAPRAAIDLAVILPVAPPASRVVPAPPTSVGLSTTDQRQPSRRSTLDGDLTPTAVVPRRGARSRVEEI